MSVRRSTLLVRGIASFVAVVLLVVGVPVALAAFVGWPLPTSFPDGDAMSRALRTSVSDEVVINTLAAIAWRTWRQLVLGLAAEAAGVVRGRERPRLPVMPVVQVLAPSSPACCSSVRRCTRHGRPWQRHRCLPRSLYFSL